MRKYKRILLKLSGEGLMGKQNFGWDISQITRISSEIKPLIQQGVQVVITCGGGNIFRGLSTIGDSLNRSAADHMGMLATIMNSLALKSIFENNGLKSVVLSSRKIDSVCEIFSYYAAEKALNENQIVICGGGTGNPFFTTDTSSVLRAIECQCDIMLKATQVDGVYNKDPKKFENAVKYDRLSYQDVLNNNLRVMDLTAIALAKENNLSIMVFNIHKDGMLNKVVNEEGIFTLIA